jgi:hypothetical protein
MRAWPLILLIAACGTDGNGSDMGSPPMCPAGATEYPYHVSCDPQKDGECFGSPQDPYCHCQANCDGTAGTWRCDLVGILCRDLSVSPD